MESFTFIQWCLEHLNYGSVCLLMAIESSIIPFPSEIVVPPAAYRAAAGELNVYLVVLSATIGALIGAYFNYFLSLWIGRPLVYRFVNSKIGHLCMLSQEKLERAEQYFVKHGSISTLVGRLIPVIRQLISVPAGLAKMSVGKFTLFTLAGAALWNIVLAALGWCLHSIVPQDMLMETIHRDSKLISLCILAVVAIVAIVVIIRYILKQKNRNNERNN